MDYEQERIELVSICQVAIDIINNSLEMMDRQKRMTLESESRYMVGNKVYPAVVSIYYDYQCLTFYNTEENKIDIYLNADYFKGLVGSISKDIDPNTQSRLITEAIVKLAAYNDV